MKRNCSNAHEGQEIVEFSVTVTVFLIIVIIIFDLGRAIYSYSVVQNSAREGARYGIIYPDDTAGIAVRARNRALGLDTSKVFVNTSLVDYDSDGKRDAIRVTVDYRFSPITPLAGAFLGLATEADFITLSGRATMRIEE